MISTKNTMAGRISQGDIYKNIEYIESVTEEAGLIVVKSIAFPLAIILTQDCDLEQDDSSRKNGQRKNDDKFLISVLAAPIYNAEHVYAGTQLSELGHPMRQIAKSKTEGNCIRNNETPRYHYLEFPKWTLIPPSIVDFKHYFSVNVSGLQADAPSKFVCRVSELYRESISCRFANYLSRIGLPAEEERIVSSTGAN